MTTVVSALLIIAIILFIWNIISIRQKGNKEKEYYELNSKLNYITATGSAFLLLAAYLGYTNEQTLALNNEKKIKDFIDQKSSKIDSIINSKDILKAGVYIINDLEFSKGKQYKFEELRTIDNKILPNFAYPPKLIINTNTGENLRIKQVTNTYFVLAEPIPSRVSFWADTTNPSYPKIVKFDVWIADYKTDK